MLATLLAPCTGAAYWERDINGAASSDNLVRSSDSTWTQILAPAANQLAQKIAALPPLASCTPGQLPHATHLSTAHCLLKPRPPAHTLFPQPSCKTLRMLAHDDSNHYNTCLCCVQLSSSPKAVDSVFVMLASSPIGACATSALLP